MQKHDHVCAVLPCHILFDSPPKDKPLSLSFANGTDDEDMSKGFGVLPLPRQRIHWISWLNEGMKINLIVMEESPLAARSATRLPRNLWQYLCLQTNTSCCAPPDSRGGFCKKLLCPSAFIWIHESTQNNSLSVICLGVSDCLPTIWWRWKQGLSISGLNGWNFCFWLQGSNISD